MREGKAKEGHGPTSVLYDFQMSLYNSFFLFWDKEARNVR